MRTLSVCSRSSFCADWARVDCAPPASARYYDYGTWRSSALARSLQHRSPNLPTLQKLRAKLAELVVLGGPSPRSGPDRAAQ